MALQPEAIAAKGVRFNDLGAGLQVLVMQPADKIRLRNVEFVIAAVDEDALFVQQGAHGAVAEHRGSLQPR